MVDFGCRLQLPRHHFAEGEYVTVGQRIFDKYMNDMEKTLRFYDELKPDILDLIRLKNANEIMERIFPAITADVFISHSGKDKNTAIGLMGFLKKELNLNAFVDSVFWGYKDLIVDSLTSPYKKECLTYKDLDEYIGHSNMMLTTSLTRMIKKTPLFILLETVNSVPNRSSTYSPWIFHEIEMFNTFVRLTPKKLMESVFNSQHPLLEWNIKLNTLYRMSQRDLEFWPERCNPNKGHFSKRLSRLDKIEALKKIL